VFKDCVPKDQEKANLLLSNRFWLKSTEQSLTAIYTDEAISPLNIFTMYKCSKDEAKFLSLYFNSVLYLSQIIMFAKQSTRGFLGLKILDFSNFFAPRYSKLGEDKKDKIAKFFDDNKLLNIASISSQLQAPTYSRINLDMLIAESLGISISKEELLNLYKLIWNHIAKLP